MKYILSILLVCLCFMVNAQKITSKLSTAKYAGTYSSGKSNPKAGRGMILVYPESDSTLLFHIDVIRGAPSYNMGSMYNRIKITADTAVFYTKYDYADLGCEWVFRFSKKGLEIETINGQYDCGFGHAVYADGNYRRRSAKIPLYFETVERTKVYFAETPPEVHNKE